MKEPPALLLRLTSLLGGDPRRIYSCDRYWFLLVVGIAEVAIAASFFVFTDESTPLAPWFFTTIGVFLVAQGAEGLFREDHEGLSLWFRILQTSLIVPLVFFWAVQWYMWWGILGVGACVLVVIAIFVWDRLQRERTPQESSS